MPAMRIGVDGRALRASSARRGVAVYLEQLLAELARGFPDDALDVLVPGPVRAGALPDAPNVRAVNASRAAHAAGTLVGRPRLDELLDAPDVLWVPAVVPVALSPGARSVVTVHDLSFEHRPRDYTAYERVWHRVARPRRLARRAQRVITVSEQVRGELIGEWGLAPERVVTVPSGPGRALAAASPPARGEPLPAGVREPCVLAVGAIEPRKLPLVLVEAHRLARSRGLGADLVFAGDGPLAGRVREAGATVVPGLSEAALDGLIARALCVVCASREEGFGFTPLEALARGCPPVVSELPVFRELLGDAAVYVPAGDADALGAALLDLAANPERREAILAAAPGRLEALSWERAARATHAVLAEAAA